MQICKRIPFARAAFVLGVTALPCLSFYDYFTSPDEQTKKAALSKSWAKIIAGTLTGFTIRWAGIKFVQHFAQAKWNPIKNAVDGIIAENHKKILSVLYPKSWLGKRDISEIDYKAELNKYTKNTGTYFAIAVMLITNFVVDAPLTAWLTNFFREKVFKMNEQKIPDENFIRFAIKQSGFRLQEKEGVN